MQTMTVLETSEGRAPKITQAATSPFVGKVFSKAFQGDGMYSQLPQKRRKSKAKKDAPRIHTHIARTSGAARRRTSQAL